jgi:hypothetical protein
MTWGHKNGVNAETWIVYDHLLLSEEFYMLQRSAFFFATLVAFLVGAHQAPAQTTIRFKSGQPNSPSGGTIDGSGTFTVACGYNLAKVALIAELSPGPGQGGYAAATTGCNSFSAEITGLPAGTYNVFARITVTNSCSQTFYFDSAVVAVTVAAPCVGYQSETLCHSGAQR